MLLCRALQRLDRSGLLAEDATSLRLLVHLKAAKAAATALPQQGELMTCHVALSIQHASMQRQRDHHPDKLCQDELTAGFCGLRTRAG